MTVIFIQAYFQHASRIGCHDCYPKMKIMLKLRSKLLANFNKKFRVGNFGGQNLGRIGKLKTQVFFFFGLTHQGKQQTQIFF